MAQRYSRVCSRTATLQGQKESRRERFAAAKTEKEWQYSSLCALGCNAAAAYVFLLMRLGAIFSFCNVSARSRDVHEHPEPTGYVQ